MSASFSPSTGRILKAALRLFIFQMHKSNKIYILVLEQDHLLPLCYYYNFMYFEKLNLS